MDIVTHGMMGLALAGPILGEHPYVGCGFVFGSVLPDLDAFSRCGGKSAFLRNHQGWTHSFLVIWGATFFCVAVLEGIAVTRGMVWSGLTGLPVGLGLGATLHALLDLTNTFGVRALAPLSRHRYCWEWLFFIDAFVIGITVPAAISAVVGLTHPDWPAGEIAVVYASLLLSYLVGKGVLRRSIVGKLPKGTVSAIPSALRPWEYILCVRNGNKIQHFRFNGLTEGMLLISETPIYDEEVQELLDNIPDYRTMRELSPAYHVVGVETDANGMLIHCRDLRTVNFNTEFGALEIRLGPDSSLVSTQLNV